MKKIFTILSILLYTLSFSQNNKIPRYIIEDGDTIGILLSIEQVQNLDNKSELLILFEDLELKSDRLNQNYIDIINKSNEKMVILDYKILQQQKENDDYQLIIINLKKQIANCEENVKLCDLQKSNKDKEIEIFKQTIRKEKFKKWLSVGGNIAIVITILFLVIK